MQQTHWEPSPETALCWPKLAQQVLTALLSSEIEALAMLCRSRSGRVDGAGDALRPGGGPQACQ